MRIFIATIGLSLFCTTIQAGDCSDGLAAVVEGNYLRAASLFEPLAKQGDSCAQVHLGDMYRLGMGVEADKSKALELYETAAAQGNGRAKLQAELMRSNK